MINELPGPTLTQVLRLHIVRGAPLDLGDTGYGRRVIVPLTGGRFTGPELNGNLLPEAAADRQLTFPDGTILGDLRCTLRTDLGHLLQMRSHTIAYGDAPGELPIRATTRLEATDPHLRWVNRGVFISVGSRRGDSAIYETYLVS
ncbi:DUF3237 domain-containing protein [Nonomuraea sp. NPDC001636]|uniref:DUF3237 domain-containing protein n=1 Tax=Nonomuraea sp. NPDC001636 TaxID=3154391 RepID=UPI00331B6BE5